MSRVDAVNRLIRAKSIFELLHEKQGTVIFFCHLLHDKLGLRLDSD